MMIQGMVSKPMLIKWTESLMITAIFWGLTVFTHNPMALKGAFPWIWFAPVLIALRYGIACSQTSLGLLVGAYLIKYPSAIYLIDFQLFLLGGFALTTLCGMFHSSWSKKIIDSQEVSTYLQRRIQNIADAYKLTALAYRALEKNYVVKPVTIRNSLENLRELSSKSDQQTAVLTRLLNILALHCSLEVAAIFPVKQQQLIPKPICFIGKIKPPAQPDYLIQECLATTSITYISGAEILKQEISDALIVAPLVNQQGSIYGVLVVQALPFLSLNDETIETIRLLLANFLAGNPVKNAELIVNHYPDCSLIFANELQRLTQLQLSTQHDSAVVAFILLPHPHQLDYLYRLKQEKRGIDTLWETALGDRKILVITMPLATRDGVELFRVRIERILTAEFQVPMADPVDKPRDAETATAVTLNQGSILFKACQVSAFPNPNDLMKDLLT